MTTGNRGDEEAVGVALLDMLLNARVCHIVVVALLHWPVCVVDGDPLGGRHAQPDLLPWRLHKDIVSFDSNHPTHTPSSMWKGT